MDDFDLTRLDPDEYDWEVPLHLARVQRTVEDFITCMQTIEVQTIEAICPDDQATLDEFCAFVDDPKVWPLAQMVVPEFRSAKEDRESDVDAGRIPIALDYVLDRDKLSGLPLPRNDKNVLTSEQDLLNQRHKQWVEYVVTGGRGREAATSAQREDVEGRVSQVQNVIVDLNRQYPTLSTPRNSERKQRDHRNKVDDSEASEAGEANEASEASEEGDVGYPKLSTPRNSKSKRRDHRNEVDDSEASEASEEGDPGSAHRRTLTGDR